MNFKKKAAGYFATHPTVDEFHLTTDGQAFINKADAESHSGSLPKKDVVSITRAEALATDTPPAEGEEERNNPPAGEDNGTPPGEEEGETLTPASDFAQLTNKELVAELTKRGITHNPKATKKDLVALLLENSPV